MDKRELVKEYLSSIAGKPEDTIRHNFLRFLEKLFPQIELQEIELEKYIRGIRAKSGYADAIVGHIIFEFKRKLDEHSRNVGKEELKKYIKNQERPESVFGFLTDGKVFEVYALKGEELEKLSEFRIEEDKAEEIYQKFDIYLFTEKNIKPTSADIARRFGLGSILYYRLKSALESAFKSLKDSSVLFTKFYEWRNLLSIVYGSGEVGEESLFITHTYLATFAKILSFVAIEKRAPNSEQELKEIITGKAFEKLGFENFVEDDFFSWFVDENVWQPFYPLLLSMADTLISAYNLSYINEDILKEIYQEMVDPETRHDLGEYYTPDWLAELLLIEAGFHEAEDKSLLDPSCGSGTFLLNAIKLLKKQGLKGKELVDFAQKFLAGMDVNPLAVIIAKTNFVLALSEDLKDYRGKLYIPIFMCDSLNARGAYSEPYVKIPIPLEEFRKIKPLSSQTPSTFSLPLDISQEKMEEILDMLIEYADPKMDESTAKRGFKSYLEKLQLTPDEITHWMSNLTLMRYLLKEPPTDTIWKFVLKNAHRPIIFSKNKFAFVVGNPPWLTYKDINRKEYQERIRHLSIKKYKLIEGKDTHLVTHLELATVFFALSEDLYLKNNGTLAFVMPRSIMKDSKHHKAFQEKYLMKSEKIIDCSDVKPLFNIQSVCVIYKKGAQTKPHVPILKLKGVLPYKNMDLSSASELFEKSEGTYKPAEGVGESVYLKEVFQGATLVPRSFWFVKPKERGTHLETDPVAQEQGKEPWKSIKLEGEVEEEFLYATLLSTELFPFSYRKLSLVIIPLKNGKLLNSQKAYAEGRPKLGKWLSQVEEHWNKLAKRTSERVKTPYERLDFQGLFSRQKLSGVVKLLYNKSGASISSCVINTNQIKEVYGLNVQGFIAEHKTHYIETYNEKEAHYLCAILNSNKVNEFIKPLLGERDIHNRPFEYLPIPRFDERNAVHLELAELSMLCHQKVKEKMKDERVLNLNYIKLRDYIRKELVREELKEIDKLVGALLGI